MKNKNTIFSIFTLFITLFLLLTCIFGWYTNNKNVSANGLTGSTSTDTYNLNLQRGYYDDALGWTWEDTQSLAFSNISPKNKFFFRIKVSSESESELNFNAKFNGVRSSVLEDELQVLDGYVCSVEANGVYSKLYEIIDNKVMVTETIDGVDEQKTLYDCTNGDINLVDYQIHNVFKFYSIGTVEPTNTDISAYEGNSLGDMNFDISVTQSDGVAYFYFALEFSDELSSAIINGLESSNCYMYQKLSISNIEIKFNE